MLAVRLGHLKVAIYLTPGPTKGQNVLLLHVDDTNYQVRHRDSVHYTTRKNNLIPKD